MNYTSAHLILDEEVCRANIRRMAEKARMLNLIFRPHFKTHQSHTIGEWFRNEGVNSCTVSSLEMAEYFAQHQWDDICISTPVNPLEINRLLPLSSSVRLYITLCDMSAIDTLGDILSSFSGIYLKTDTGYGRAGIKWNNLSAFKSIVREICRHKGKLHGFLVHDGHSYHALGREEVMRIRSRTNAGLRQLKSWFTDEFPELIASVGDTPSCSISDDFEGIDEIRPGNFVFYDLMQWKLQSCRLDDIALRMFAPIISVNQSHAVLHCGGVHLSKESIEIVGMGRVYGQAVNSSDCGSLKNSWLTSLSQEHGILVTDKKNLSNLKPGSMVEILPVHSCFTANTMKGYFLKKGGFVPMMKCPSAKVHTGG